ncbi:MAG TPA: class I SAM-dependent methyltransferase [Candidatus Acidoferrum sp.]|nr:class I SAM-dependent methyltransferase [Candidatus Acidoferrum sp.]
METMTGKDERAQSGQELFDGYAKSYDAALSSALAPSGEGREYFAEGRVKWLQRCLRELGVSPLQVLDFGCGDGSTTPMLQRILGAESCVGVDVSPKSLEVARASHANERIRFELIREMQSGWEMDLAYCNGVFHHIAPEARPEALQMIRGALKRGVFFSFWENNAWNPATRYVMSRCAFDEDAILLSPREARTLLRESGFEVIRTDFRFIFPRALRGLRKLEDLVYRLPLGTQFQVLCRKSE